MSRIKILLTDGTSPAALQAINALGLGGHHVIDVCDPRPVSCPARFNRCVRRTLRCPSFSVCPISYAEFLLRRLKAERYDVLLPAHDQTYLAARFRKELEALTRVPVPDFAAVEQIHDRLRFSRLMEELELAQAPPHDVPPNTAQGVFQHGRLLAFHASQVRVRGSAGVVVREALQQPDVRDDLARLGARLDWHGALSVDYSVDAATGRPMYIEAHARLGETANAVTTGVNLPQWLVRVALADRPLSAMPPPSASRATRTHSSVTGLLSMAHDTGSRWAIVSQLADVMSEKGISAQSCDEWNAPEGNMLQMLPAAATILRILLWPGTADSLVKEHSDSYVLSEQTLQVIHKLSGKLL
ncbi:MAG: hypothetical protein FJ271_21955 [Planctomycetes bacterium]|nr:hypothetical protein [Planctomycetota bacterium]